MNTGDSSGHFTGSNRQYICHHVYELTSESRSCGHPASGHVCHLLPGGLEARGRLADLCEVHRRLPLVKNRRFHIVEIADLIGRFGPYGQSQVLSQPVCSSGRLAAAPSHESSRHRRYSHFGDVGSA